MSASIAAVGIGEGTIVVWSLTVGLILAACAVGAWVAVTAIRRHLPGTSTYDTGWWDGYEACAARQPAYPDWDEDQQPDDTGRHAAVAEPTPVEVTGLLPVTGVDLVDGPEAFGAVDAVTGRGDGR